MAVCLVTLTGNTLAISEAVKFQPFPNQMIDNVAIDGSLVTASISGNAYSANLIQGAKYRLIAPRFSFHNASFTVPASGSANLASLIESAFTG